MTKIYIVVGHYGEYSDHVSVIKKAFKTRKAAELEADRLAPIKKKEIDYDEPYFEITETELYNE